MSWDMSSVLKYLIVGLVSLVIMVAMLPTILDQIAKLQGAVAGNCQVTIAGTIANSPPVGTTWELGNTWFDGRFPIGTLPTSAATGGKCEKGTVGTAFPVPVGGATIYYIPTATSETPYTTIMTTIITLMPVILVLGLIVWALTKFGVLGRMGGGSGGGAIGGGRGSSAGDAN